MNLIYMTSRLAGAMNGYISSTSAIEAQTGCSASVLLFVRQRSSSSDHIDIHGCRTIHWDLTMCLPWSWSRAICLPWRWLRHYWCISWCESWSCYLLLSLTSTLKKVIITPLWCWSRRTRANKKKTTNLGSKHRASCQRKRTNENSLYWYIQDDYKVFLANLAYYNSLFSCIIIRLR